MYSFVVDSFICKASPQKKTHSRQVYWKMSNVFYETSLFNPASLKDTHFTWPNEDCVQVFRPIGIKFAILAQVFSNVG